MTTTQVDPAAAEASSAVVRTSLQRIIAPRAGDPLDVRSLYLDEDDTNRRRSRAVSRTSLTLPAQSEVSFATYFNAFPASYWRRWTTLETVVLQLRLQGRCRVDVYRSKADGSQIHVSGDVVATADATTLEFTLDLKPFEDGGWYWFDVTTDDGPVEFSDSAWCAAVPAPGRAAAAICICTFNRPDDCVGALAALGEDPDVLAAVEAVIVADQGNRKVRDTEAFPAAAEQLGDRLRIHDQANLGGSGGFSRAMHEALTSTGCEQIILLDDDIVIEPDSILRAIAFSRFVEHDMLVGGQMLNLQARSRLRSMGEVVDRSKFTWRAAPNVHYDHDFAKRTLRQTPWLHRRVDVDYNGWWMCLIPRTVAAELGLPLPLFIKWDDTEYSLRAANAGYPTTSLPGAAIWHMPWSDKDDATDWQAYFHLRNRLVVAALYSPYRRGGELIRHSMKSVIKHLLSLEYSTVALQNLAIRDFLAGPQALFGQLPTALGEVRAERSRYDDGAVLASSRSLPLPSMDAVKAERFLKPPTNPVTIGATLASGLAHNLLPTKPEHHKRPQLNIAQQDARWFLLARLDGATVATADGRGVAYRKRNPQLFWTLLGQAARNHRELRREFPRMRRDFKKGMGELTSHDAWQRAYER